MPAPKKKTSKKKTPTKKPAQKKPANKLQTRAPLAIALYGPGGVGKTSFCAQFPRPGFIIGKDDGINDLYTYGQVPEPAFVDQVQDFEELIAAIGNASVRDDCDSVILDNLTDFEEMCFKYHCETYFEGNWGITGFYSFNKGPKNAAKTDWPTFLETLQAVWDSGKHVVLIAHSKIKNRPNPDGEDYLAYEPQLDAEIWSRTHYWAKATLFYSLRVEVVKESKISKPKANAAEFDRFIFTEPSPTFEAKNRYGLSPVIDCGNSAEEAFENFASSFK